MALSIVMSPRVAAMWFDQEGRVVDSQWLPVNSLADQTQVLAQVRMSWPNDNAAVRAIVCRGFDGHRLQMEVIERTTRPVDLDRHA